MNLNIIVNANDTIDKGEISFAAGSNMTPEIITIALLIAIPEGDPAEVFDKHITLIII